MSDRSARAIKEVDEALLSLLDARESALRELRDVEVMKTVLLQHEAHRLSARLGKNHARVRQLKSEIDASLDLAQTLEVEHEIARIRQPVVSENEALVHGRVTDATGRGIATLTVCLLDEAANPAPGLMSAETDLSGYYALVIPEEVAKQASAKEKPALYLALFTPRNRPVYQGKIALAIEPGVQLTESVALDRRTLSEITKPKPAPKPPSNETVMVPEIVGLAEDEAIKQIRASGLIIGERSEQAVIEQIGLVLDQDPTVGISVEPESAVALVIGVAQQVEVPDLRECPLDEAENMLGERHLAIGSITERSGKPEGIVLDQRPKALSRVDVFTEIDLIVGTWDQGQVLREKIVDLIAQNSEFDSLGISVRSLNNRFEEHELNTYEQFRAMLELDDGDLRDGMRLPNLRSARLLRDILEEVSEQLTGK